MSTATEHRASNKRHLKELSSEFRHSPRRGSDTAMACQLNLPSAQRAALFTSDLQDSQHPSCTQVRTAIAETIRRYGAQGCLERMAQEFGDHPDAATIRMVWAKQAVADAFSRPTKDSLALRSSYSPKNSGSKARSTAPHV